MLVSRKQPGTMQILLMVGLIDQRLGLLGGRRNESWNLDLARDREAGLRVDLIWLPPPGQGRRGTPGQSGFQQLGDQVGKLASLGGGADFDPPHEWVRQVEGGSHASRKAGICCSVN